MILQIEAIDTLFFRDGKPFEMGDENWANGIFPPLPSAFYGAIRTAYFSQNPQKLKDWNDKKIEDPTRNLKIKGIYLYKDIFLAPIFSEFVSEDEEDIFFERNSLPLNEEVFSSSKTAITPYSKEVEGMQGFLPIGMFSALSDFVNDEQSQTKTFVKMDSIFTKEPKIGIARQNSTKTTEEGKLYRVALNRLEVAGNPNKKLSFWVDVNIEILGEQFNLDFLKLGGENKLAECKTANSIDVHFPKPTIVKYFKLALLSPAIFTKTEEGRKEGGWLPDCFVYEETQKAYIGTWQGVRLKLLRAFVGSSVPVGGFDVREKQPKMMYRAVPTGSVYHFEILDNTDNKAIYEKFGNPENPLSDILSEQGFGLSIVGLLKN